MKTKHIDIKSQRGAALAVSLIILLVLTILGVNSMSSMVLEERMTGHARQSMVASQASQIALRAAETWIQNNVNADADLNNFRNGSIGLFSPHVPPLQPLAFNITIDADWPPNSVAVPLAAIAPPGAKTQLVGQDPRYIIEYLGQTGKGVPNLTEHNAAPHAFRITAIGWGEDITARFLAQSTYQKKL